MSRLLRFSSLCLSWRGGVSPKLNRFCTKSDVKPKFLLGILLLTLSSLCSMAIFLWWEVSVTTQVSFNRESLFAAHFSAIRSIEPSFHFWLLRPPSSLGGDILDKDDLLLTDPSIRAGSSLSGVDTCFITYSPSPFVTLFVRADVKLGGLILLSVRPRNFGLGGSGETFGSWGSSVSSDAALMYSASYNCISLLLIRYLESSPSRLWLSGIELERTRGGSLSFPIEVRFGMLAALLIFPTEVGSLMPASTRNSWVLGSRFSRLEEYGVLSEDGIVPWTSSSSFSGVLQMARRLSSGEKCLEDPAEYLGGSGELNLVLVDWASALVRAGGKLSDLFRSSPRDLSLEGMAEGVANWSKLVP